MKIRKPIRLFTLCLSLCLCLSLVVACDKQTHAETQPESQPETSTESETPFETATQAETETDTKAETETQSESTAESDTVAIDRYTVTREEWIAALDFAVPVTSTEQLVWWPKGEFSSEDRFIYCDVVLFDENKTYTFDWDESFTNVHDEFYYVKEGESYYVCRKIANEWVWAASSQSSMEHLKDTLVGWDDAFGLSGEFLYDDFTYDEVKQVYVCEQKDIALEGETVTYYNTELKFRNGVLEYYYLESYVDGYVAIKTTVGYAPVEIVLPPSAS